MRLPLPINKFQIEPVVKRREITDGSGRVAIGNHRAFTLVEILVVIALLSFIIIGLMAMFGQTQRAFRLGMTQNDVLESGRMATDMIVRDLEQMTPSYLPAQDYARRIQPNFYAWLFRSGRVGQPLVQLLPGSSLPRTNFLEDVFFLARQNQEWIGIGYFVRTNSPKTGSLSLPLVRGPVATVGVGTLYRFETTASVLSLTNSPAQMFADFQYQAAQGNEINPNVSRIMDGVIHFQVRTYNTNGVWIVSPFDVSTTQANTAFPPLPSVPPGQVAFYSNAVPASVELEIGVLEDRVWERYKSLDSASQYNYIRNQAGHVHLFFRRVPIRTVDPLAYR
jgi:Prokaryotic N-terminal methylation motif